MKVLVAVLLTLLFLWGLSYAGTRHIEIWNTESSGRSWMQFRGTEVDGKLVGLWEEWDCDGRLVYSVRYDGNGQITKVLVEDFDRNRKRHRGDFQGAYRKLPGNDG